MEAEKTESQTERDGTETPYSSRENQPPAGRLPDLSPEKDPMGAGRKIPASHPSQDA